MNREELLAALKKAAPALSSKGLYPLLENFCIRKDAVLAYDDTLSIVVPYVGAELGCLPGKTLLGLLTASGAAEVEVLGTSEKLKLKLGRSTVEIPALPVGDFDKQCQLPSEKEAVSVKVTPALLAALSRVSISVGWDSLTPWAFGVTLEMRKSGAELFATNNFTLARSSAPDVVGKGTYILPPRFVEEVLKQGKADVPEFLLLWADGSWIGAKLSSGTKLYCRSTPEADASKFRELFDSMKDGEAVPIPAGFEGSLNRAKVFMTASIVAERTASFSVTDGKLVVGCETSRGSMRDVHKFQHPDCSVKAPPELLASGLSRALRMCLLSKRAVRLEGGDFVYIVSGTL